MTPEFVTNNENILSSARWRKNLLSRVDSWENYVTKTTKSLLNLHIYLKKICLDLTTFLIMASKDAKKFVLSSLLQHSTSNLEKIACSLQIVIWLQTDKFTFDQMQSYQTSVVERECVEGIINTDYVTKYTTLAFLRKIDDINMSDTRGGKYFQSLFAVFKGQ